MMSPEAYAVANRKDHPRILLLDDGSGFAERFQNIDLPGTVKIVTDLKSVDQNEWDAVFMNQPLVTGGGSHRGPQRRVSHHLRVFVVLEPNIRFWGSLDRVIISDESVGGQSISVRWDVPGHEIRPMKGLEKDLRAAIVKVGEKREFQHGVVLPTELPNGMSFEPFALGPQDVVLAGKYNAAGTGEVWFVPAEIEDLGPWATAAFSSWRRQDSRRFPGIPDWWKAPEWFSPAEREVAEQIAKVNMEFDSARARYKEEIERLEGAHEAAQLEASRGIRQLLRGQDVSLQDAVRESLEFLGFHVRDMDLEWNGRERREDFRVTDPEDPGWLVLGEATGVRGNAKGGKITALQGYVSKYLYEEKPDQIPGMWYLLNREVDKDPNNRSTILRDDEIMPFADCGGLVLDTTAIFVLTIHAAEHPEEKMDIRKYLRTTTGLIDLNRVRTWVASR